MLMFFTKESLLSPRVVTAAKGSSFTIKALLFFTIKARLCLTEAAGLHGHTCSESVKSSANFHQKFARRVTKIWLFFLCLHFFIVDLFLGSNIGNYFHNKDIYILRSWHKKSKISTSPLIRCPKLKKCRFILSLGLNPSTFLVSLRAHCDVIAWHGGVVFRNHLI